VELDENSFVKNDHPTPCLWVRNDTSAPVYLFSSIILGLIGPNVYLDDVAISNGSRADSAEEEGLDAWDIHLLRIGPFIRRCAKHHLRLNPDKCHIGDGQINYLGYFISADGLRPDPAKVSAIHTSYSEAYGCSRC